MGMGMGIWIGIVSVRSKRAGRTEAKSLNVMPASTRLTIRLCVHPSAAFAISVVISTFASSPYSRYPATPTYA